jgi:hypothetical protein
VEQYVEVIWQKAEKYDQLLVDIAIVGVYQARLIAVQHQTSVLGKLTVQSISCTTLIVYLHLAYKRLIIMKFSWEGKVYGDLSV